MSIEFHEKGIALFLKTAVERHKIYKAKEQGLPKPWSDDPVFQQFFFCNVFRQYDKCSKWIIENIAPFGRLDLLLLYRFISTYETYERIESHCDLDDLEEIKLLMAAMHRSKERIFSGCFIRNPSTSEGVVNTYKAPFIVIKDLEYDEFDPSEFGHLELLCGYLQRFTGIGGFMAYEYACDLEYSKLFNPFDKNTWANKGPGATRGMSLVLHGNATIKMNQKDWLDAAREIYPLMVEEFARHFPEEVVTMREVEHWLCELQKYVKYRSALGGGAKVKHRKYEGG